MCGLVFEEDLFATIAPNPTKFFTGSSPILVQNLITFEPVIKQLNIAHRAYGFSHHFDSDVSRKQGLRVFKASVHSFPKDKHAWCSLGKIYEFEGQIESAKSCYQRACEIDPKFEEAAISLNRLATQPTNQGNRYT